LREIGHVLKMGSSLSRSTGWEPDGAISLPGWRSAELVAHLRQLQHFSDAGVLLVAGCIGMMRPQLWVHCQEVARLSRAVAIACGLSAEQAQEVYTAALVHDIGKIVIEQEVLNKAGALTQAEWRKVHAHPRHGAVLVRLAGAARNVADMVYHHHERPDGRGYPDGLAGDSIPVGARIIAVCDAYDAMTAGRVYHAAMSPAAALEELVRLRGAQFHGDCVAALLRVLGEAGNSQGASLSTPPQTKAA